MAMKKRPETDTAKDNRAKTQPSAEDRQAAEHVKALQIRINTCFVAVILPAVFDVENDLHQAGYWNRLDIDQTTTPGTGKPDIKKVSVFFYPENTDSFSHSPGKIDATYQAHIFAAGNLRDIVFSIRFPKRIPPLVEIDDLIIAAEDTDPQIVNGFLERFVKGALDAYNSDRMLR